LASAPGRSGVAVLRLSGEKLDQLAELLTGLRPRARHAHYAEFRDPAGEVLDRGLMLWFPAPHSYTGEDVLELHTHGGEVLPRRVMLACLAFGATLARPGEFTRRAFEHGKLDLVQAEAVADLIEASGEAAARGALRSLSGAFSRRLRTIQDRLTQLRLRLEGALDFPEEGLPASDVARAQEALAAVHAEVMALIAEASRGQSLRAGRQVVLFGAPNVGKSSLLNRLAGEDLALVSEFPGTTRDALRSHLEIGGLRLELIDTAGVRNGAQAVEKLGIERSWQAVARADLILRLHAFDIPDAPEEVFGAALPASVPLIEVWNKSDLASAAAPRGISAGSVRVSARTGDGIEALERAILAALGWSAAVEPGFLARSRHVEALRDALGHLELALAVEAEELLAEELRLAQRALDTILGEFAADDLLGEIFSRFCIGK
jgi:tRNA modification GTPase